MGRYTGPRSRLSRREGMDLQLKTKCASVKRPFPPGMHGLRRTRLSDYGVQLREKQKVKRIYGVWERQFRRYFGLAQKSKGITGQTLLQILECRLDNVIFRAGMSITRSEGRQMVGHQGVSVNGKSVDIPSFSVKVGDVIQVDSPEKHGQAKRAKDNLERTKDRVVPSWLQVDTEQLKAIVVRLPQKEDVGMDIQEQLIVELYSK